MNTFASKLGLNLGSLTSLARSLKIEVIRQPGETDGSYAVRLNHAVRTWGQRPKSEPLPPPIPVAPVVIQDAPPPEPIQTIASPADEPPAVSDPADERDPDEVNCEIIESMVSQFYAGDEDVRNTLRLVVAASIIGTNADKLASLLGLNRDKFVRPRAKRLRDNGIWVDGKIAVYTLSTSDEDIRLGILLAALVAEDLVELSE